MKAICLINDANEDASTTGVIEEEAAKPEPGPGEVLIQVYAAGVTHTELGWYPTLHTKTGEARRRPIPGHEFSGIVAAAGADVNGVSIGTEVYGMNDWFDDGAVAEYCVTVPKSIAPKPPRLSHAEAASVPIGALTAWQGLFDRAKLQAGERVLVQGGAGAVGVFAVQLAHLRGAHVVATGSPKNFDFIRSLGAEEVIDYNFDYYAERAGSFDVVFDVVGGETLERSWSLLRPSGRMVAIASQTEGQADERAKRAFFIVEPSRQQLLEISHMLNEDRLRPVVDSVVPLAKAPEAYTGRFAEKRGRGKVVVEITKASAGANAREIGI